MFPATNIWVHYNKHVQVVLYHLVSLAMPLQFITYSEL